MGVFFVWLWMLGFFCVDYSATFSSARTLRVSVRKMNLHLAAQKNMNLLAKQSAKNDDEPIIPAYGFEHLPPTKPPPPEGPAVPAPLWFGDLRAGGLSRPVLPTPTAPAAPPPPLPPLPVVPLPDFDAMGVTADGLEGDKLPVNHYSGKRMGE